MSQPISYQAPDEAALQEIAQDFCQTLTAPAMVFLSGDLGAGKTAFVRAVLRCMGVTGAVKSPTYSLIESYKPGNVTCHHLDLYRLGDPEELVYIGFRDLLDEHAIVFVEWPEQAINFLPEPTHRIQIAYAGTGRLISIHH